MKRIFISLLCILPTREVLPQTATFDIATYSIPRSWKKDTKEGVVIYTKMDTLSGSYCMIALYAAIPSTGNVQADFQHEWNELAVIPFNTGTNPATESLTTPEGWNVMSAASAAEKDGAGFYIVLTVFNGFGKTTAVLANLNDQAYVAELDKFLASVKLDKKAVVATAKKEPGLETNLTVINGKWGKSSSSPSAYTNGVMNNLAYSGYTKGQYDFKTNGTYIFQGESWGGYLNATEYRLIDENGSYRVTGNQLTLSPVKSLYRVVDQDGKMKNSEQLNLSKRIYSWQTYYYEGIQETNLVLTASRENVIDGGFSSNSLFPNSFLYSREKQPEFKFHPLK